MFSAPRTTPVHWLLKPYCDTGVTSFKIKITHGRAWATGVLGLGPGKLSIDSLSQVSNICLRDICELGLARLSIYSAELCARGPVRTCNCGSFVCD